MEKLVSKFQKPLGVSGTSVFSDTKAGLVTSFGFIVKGHSLFLSS
jgi:hypothetical protein